MDKKVLIAIAAVVMLAAAGCGAVLLLNNGPNNGSDNNVLSIDSPGTYSKGEYDKVIIGAGVGDGDVVLKGIKIVKELIIRGGGSHSITMDGCDASGAKTTVEKEGGEAPRVNLVNSQVGEMDVTGQVIIEGDANSKVQTVNAAGADVTVQGDSTKVDEVKATENANVNVTGGNVSKVDASGANVTVSGDNTKVDEVKATGNTNVTVSSGNVAKVDAAGSTVNVTGENASIDNLDISGQSTVNVQNGTVDSMNMQQGSSVSLDVGADATLQTVTYADNVAVTTTGANTESKLSEADQKMADGAQTNGVTINGQNQHIHNYTILVSVDWTTLDRTAKTVTATIACESCDENSENNTVIRTIPVNEYILQPTCTDDGYTVYFTEYKDNGSPRYDQKVALGHDYEKSCVWGDEHSSATVRFVCKHDSTHTAEFVTQDVQSQITQPTCEEAGKATYTISGTRYGVDYEFTDIVTTQALGHDYGPAHPDWSTLDRTNLTVVVRSVCNNDQSHILSETVQVEERVIEPTCTDEGYTVYFTAIPGDNGSKRFDINPALGHDYSVRYDWEQGGLSCKVTLVCAHVQDHNLEMTVNSALTDSKDATCTAAGYRTYSVSGTFEGVDYSDTKTIDLPAIGHDYTVAYQWSNDGTECTVIYTCANDHDHDHNINAEVTSTVLTAASCTAAGTIGYSVSGDYDGVHYEDSTTREVPATGHTYGDVVFVWSDDNSECTAVRTCTVCGDELTEHGHVGMEVLTEPDIGVEGSARYTATFNSYDAQVKVVPIPMLNGFTITVYGGKVALKGQEPTVSVIHVAENTVVTVSQPGAGFTHWTDDYGDYIPGTSFDILVACDLYVTAHYENDPAYGEWTLVNERTCTQDGLWYREAEGMREYRTVPAYGHISDGDLVVDMPAACTAEGSGHTVCERCGAEIQQSIPATGHHHVFEVSVEASGSTVGTMRGECPDCGDVVFKDYISPVYPTGDMVVRFDWSHVRDVTSADRDEVHTMWKVTDAHGVERQAYLYQIQRDIHKNGYISGMDVTSWFFWVDYGDHSPVYVARHNSTTPVYGGANNNVSWAVAGYVDDLSEFIYLIDNLSVEVTIEGQEMHLGLGLDNGNNASALFDLYNAWANVFNSGKAGLYQTSQQTYLGWNCTVYSNEDESYWVNEDNCCVRWSRSNMQGGIEHGDTLRVVSIDGEFTRPFTQGYWNSNDFPQFSAYYFNNMPTLENSTYFCIKLINGSYNSADFTMGNVRTNFFNGDSRDHVMWIEPNLPNHYRLDGIEVLDQNGTWVAVPYVKVSSHYEFDIQDRSINGLYGYMMGLYPDRFVMPNDPAFNGVYVRCVTSLIEPDSTVTITGGTFRNEAGEIVSTGPVYGGKEIYPSFGEIYGKEVVGMTVSVNGGDPQTIDDYWSYTVPEGSTVTIAPIYEDREGDKVRIDFSCTEGGSIDGVSGMYFVYDTVYSNAIPEYGYALIGWYDVTDGSEPSEDNFYTEWSQISVDVGMNAASYRAIFAPIDGRLLNEEYTIVLVTDGFIHWEGKPVYLTALYGNQESDVTMYVHADPNRGDVHRWDVIVNLEKNEGGELVNGDNVQSQFPGDDNFSGYVWFRGDYTTVDAVFNEDVTYYTVEVYNNGQLCDQQTVAGDREYVTPETPEREGYDFLGWSTEEDGTGDTYSAGYGISVISDLTLYAKWKAKVYRTWVDIDAPFKSTPNGAAIDVTYGETSTVPAGFATVTGATITSWYYMDGNNRIQIPADGTGSIPYGIDRIYAVLEYTEYRITFDKGAVDATGTVDDVTFTLEDLTNEISYYSYRFANGSITFERPAYNFSKWMFDDKAVTGSKTYIKIDSTILKKAEDNGNTIDLTAIWVGKEYYVKYSRGDIGNESFLGTLSSSSFPVKADAPLTLNAGTAFSCSNLVLLGWNTAIDGSGRQYGLGESVGLEFIVANYEGNTTTITLYALWARSTYGVTFHGPEDSVYSTSNGYFSYNTPKALPAVSSMGEGFTIDGYTFLYWTDDPQGTDGTHYTDGAAVTALTRTGSYDLYGVWAPNTYTVTFDANGGDGSMEGQEFTVNVPGNLTANAYTKDGHHFEYWCNTEYNQGEYFNDGAEVNNLFVYGQFNDHKFADTVTIYAIWCPD